MKKSELRREKLDLAAKLCQDLYHLDDPPSHNSMRVRAMAKRPMKMLRDMEILMRPKQ